METMIRSGLAGLTKKSCAPGLHGLDDGVHAAVGGEDQHRHAHAAAAHLLERLQPREAGHHPVEHHHVGGLAAGQAVERLLAALGLGHGEALAFEDRLDQPTLSRIVVNDEDRLGHCKHPSSPARNSVPDGWAVLARYGTFLRPRVKIGFRNPQQRVNSRPA
jgi:hypothetical protein